MNKIKAKNPLVINLTNNVTINDIANMLSMINASPIMSSEIAEIKELLNIAQLMNGSLVINIGTVTKVQAQLMKKAATIASNFGIPIVLDPVGAGASAFRTDLCRELLSDNKITVVRGNFSEIGALIDAEVKSKGVDSVATTEPKFAQILAKKYNTTVLMSGKIDYLADATNFQIIKGGSDLLPRISGTGCMLSAMVGAFVAVYPPLVACEKALDVMLKASEIAETKAKLVPEFKFQLMNEIARRADES